MSSADKTPGLGTPHKNFTKAQKNKLHSILRGQGQVFVEVRGYGGGGGTGPTF